METDTESTAATRRECRKQDRRQAIIDAARASFLEHGYAGTSMSGLVKTLGGSKATLWGYFRSKEELFAAVVEDVSLAFRTQIDDVLRTETGLEATITSFCRTFLRKITSPEGLATWRLIIAESGRFPEVGQIFYEKASGPVQDTLRLYFLRQIEAGKLIQDDPANLVETLMSLCIGQHMRAIWGLEPLTAAQLEECALRFTKVFLATYSTAQ